MIRWLAYIYATGAIFCAAFAASSAGEADPHVQPEAKWDLTIEDPITTAALSPDTRCVAAVTDKGLVVVDASDGRVLWRRDYRTFSSWMTGALERAVSVAPGCEWAAVGGYSGYRYLWELRRGGGSKYVRTAGTPRALAVSHKGDLLAVGTAGGHLYLLKPFGEVLRDIDLGQGVIQGLAFSEDDRFLVITDGSLAGVFTRTGEVVWQHVGGKLDFSRDLKWFVLSYQPTHLADLGSVELMSQTGVRIWQEALHAADAVIAPDGSFVIASGVLFKDCPVERLTECATQTGEQPKEKLFVFDRQGNIVSRYRSPRGELRFVSADGQYVIKGWGGDVVCQRTDSRVVWEVHGTDPLASAAIARDLTVMILADGRVLRAYALPVASVSTPSPAS